MSVYVDFCFTVGGRHAVVTGWGVRDAVTPAFELVDAGAVPLAAAATHLWLHRRADLVDERAVGFVMVFHLATAAAGGEAPAAWTLHGEGFAGPVAARCTGPALDGFVALAGEEPFFTVLSAIGDGRLPPLEPRAAALVHARVRRQALGLAERPGFAAAFDEAIADPESGRALVSGWLLLAADNRTTGDRTTGDRAAPAVLLAVAPAGVAGAAAAFDAWERPDVASFRGRYPAGARPGFVATVATPHGLADAFAVLVVTTDSAIGGGAIATAAVRLAPAGIAALLRRFDEVTAPVDGADRTRLRRRLAGIAGPAHNDLVVGTGTGTADPRPLVALEHDGRTAHLRDVVGRLAALGWRDLDLALPGRTADRAVHDALEGARRDTPGLVVRLVGQGREGLAAAAAADRPLVYLRSSILMQSDVAGWLAGVAGAGAGAARLAVFDGGLGGTAATLDGPPAAVAAAIARKALPFAAAVRGGPALAALLGEGRQTLTFGGLMLWALGRFPAGTLEVRTDATDLYLGEEAGGAAQRLPGGMTRYDLDREAIALGD